MARNEIAVVEGNLFLVSNLVGDVEPGTLQGLYYADTRFLSRYALRMAGQSPLPLSAENVEHHAATFYTTNPAMKGLPSGSLTIVRDRLLCDKVQDELTLLNHTGRALCLRLTLDFAADFADIFEVRGAVAPHPAPVAASIAAEGGLAFTVHYPSFACQTRVDFSERPEISGTQVAFTLALPPRGQATLAISITPLMDGTPAAPACPYRALRVGPTATLPADELVQPAVVQAPEVDRWVAMLPKLSTPHAALSQAYDRTLCDLDGDGFVEYLRHSRLGLRNQGWKDSEDAICFADGTLAEAPSP